MPYDTHMVFLICLSQAIINMADIRLLYVPYVSHTVYTIKVAYSICYIIYVTHMVFLICLSQAIIDMANIRSLYVPCVSQIMFPKWVTYYRY
jgi:hypothetical protein